MNTIEERIQDLQIKNFESAYFVPTEKVEEVLTKGAIQEIVISCGIEVQKREETVSIIQAGARKILAILILMRKEGLIRSFIEHDQFQTEKLDAKLPVSELWLQTLIGEKPAKKFCQTQWMFIAPFFRNDLSHRTLENDIVLPFTSSRHIGSGAFGTVSEVTLDPAHQGIRATSATLSGVKLVRKRIELSDFNLSTSGSGVDTATSYSEEGDILSILRLVNHPNIVRLATTFSHRGSYNLLFFPAEGNLSELLERENKPLLLQIDDAFLIALQGLASALATLHEFSACAFDLEMIGCHHDLKPSNILVDGDKFLLADFGLSRIRPPNADSKTIFKGADSNYIAPESEFGENVFERAFVGRKSDVWAFGCILAEILTYIVLGCSAVKRFEEGRRDKIGNWVLYQFHSGGKPNAFVKLWIDDLEEKAPVRLNGLCSLVRSMLEIDPSKRPNSSSVLSKLSFVSIRSQYNCCRSKFEALSTSTDSFSVNAEFERLKLWGTAFYLDNSNGSWEEMENLSGNAIDFRDLVQCFSDITAALSLLAGSTKKTPSFNPGLHQLRRHIDKLCRLLPQRSRDKLESSLEILLLSGNDHQSLWEMQSEFEEVSVQSNTKLLAIAKYMSSLSKQMATDSSIKKFELEEIDIQDDFGAQASLASVTERAKTHQLEALVEWLEYDLQWVGTVGQELVLRVEAIAALLQRTPRPSGFRCFDCVGYFHEVRRHSFGLVFALPDASQNSLKTLKSLIRQLRPRQKRLSLPFLGDVFALAHSLASSVLEFHKAGWLHKNISSLNIVFFHDTESSARASVD